jgi:pyridoxal phosphate enzyme (YggS family)
MTDLEQKLEQVRARMERAAQRAGRNPKEITLIAVTKIFPAETILAAYALGLRHFGENYVQEFERKLPALAELAEARFHLIGHLQSNKARQAAEIFDSIQTVDSAKLARRLDEGVEDLEVMLEVKLSPEGSKTGVDPAEVGALADAVRSCPNLRLTGLMTMPPWSDEAEPSRPYFRSLRQLAEHHGLAKLSMGMSHDFEVAIEEGATHIRVGTALFGPRKKA